MNYLTEKRLSRRVYLWGKKLLGFRMMYGELAVIAGDGPCQRCVGRAVVGPPSDCRPDGCDSITHNAETHIGTAPL